MDGGSRLSPSQAKWIWLPAGRTLPNTFALFRIEVDLADAPESFPGWICADSRYELRVNGRRVQWGPAPSDPRMMEADPFDLAPHLKAGRNCISVRVLYYGFPEGTWAFGKPGLILWDDSQVIASGAHWKCFLDRSQPPGQAPRWYLRALQEQRDHRLEPLGWDEAGFDDSAWLPSKVLSCDPDETPAGSHEGIYHQDWVLWKDKATKLVKRTIPLMAESLVSLEEPLEAHRLIWKGPVEDWFDFRIKNYAIEPCDKSLRFTLPEGEGRAFRFDLEKEGIGFPWVELTCPEGTVVEIISQESVHPRHQGWLENHFHLWSRHVCREGFNRLEAFDYEAVKHLQIHIHGSQGEVTLHRAGVRLREYAWPSQPQFQVDDPELQRLFEANIQTVRNSVQDITVDGMARERQQYSGDGSHQLQYVQPAFGTSAPAARFLRQFGMGQLPTGVFMDSWPCGDRLSRLWQKPFGLSDWGPIIDHSIGFCLDHYHYWMNSGDLVPVKENWPKLMKFARFIESELEGGVMDAVKSASGQHSVWIDHIAFRRQEEKSLALTLYAAAALGHGLAPLAVSLEEAEDAAWLKSVSSKMALAAEAKWWSREKQAFVNSPDGRMDDRSLATALLYGFGPKGGGRMAEMLVEQPADLGLSYPANTPWLYWALIEAGRIDAVIKDLKKRWVGLPSVVLNGSIQEMWAIDLGSIHLMSHCAVGPLTALYHGLLGLKPLKPGYAEYQIRPTLSGLKSVEITAHLPIGALHLKLSETRCEVLSPHQGAGWITLDGSKSPLKRGAWQSFNPGL